MMFTLTLLPWAILAYVFRAQIPTFLATLRADYSWVKSWFVKTPVLAVLPPVVVPAVVADDHKAEAAALVAAVKQG
jgi:hypothetical protein